MLHLTPTPLALLVLVAGLTLTVGCASSSNRTDAAALGEPVLRHVVLFKFKDSATDQQIAAVVEAFRALPEQVPQIAGYEDGVNNSPEGLDKGYTHAFVVTFKSEADRDAYLPHPAHQAFVAKLGPVLEEPLVIDYWTNK